MSGFRPAQPADADALARLLVQLYDYEAPGSVVGERQRVVELVRRIFRAGRGRAVAGRFVIERGLVVAMGGLLTRELPRPYVPVTPIVLGALRLLGPIDAVRTAVGLARGAVANPGRIGEREAQVHSVVVDQPLRGRGLGAALMAELEAEAAREGKETVLLQVVEHNERARAFYRRLGYVEGGVLPRSRLARRLGYPTVVMQKTLTSQVGAREVANGPDRA